MDLSKMSMIPGDIQPGEKSRYYVWLPQGRDIGAPFCEFDPIPLDSGVLSRLKEPTDIYLCYDEEDKSRIPQVGKLVDGNNVGRERDDLAKVNVEKAELNYRGLDMEGANWLLMVWR